MPERDADGQPKAKGFHYHRNVMKSLDALYGLCAGMMADGRLDDREIVMLDTWLRESDDLIHDWPANVIAGRIRDALRDRVITEEERVDLQETLSKLLGGALEETGAASGMATRLPVDQVQSVTFDGRTFCLTGKFIYGPRKKCEQAIIDRGGQPADGVTRDLHYLVIGTLASRDWMYTSHGRKIEKAVQLKEQGREILILAEEDWVPHLQG